MKNKCILLFSIAMLAVKINLAQVGIGTTTPTSPLSFPNTLGKKLSFWNAGPNNDFGIGINTGVMQLYTAGTDKIAFGWGNANAFNETVAIHTGTGMIAYPNVVGNKISFWRSGPNNDYGIGLNTGVLQFYTAGSDKMAWGYGNTNAFTETMTFLTGSGQLGIGTTTPAASGLHINKDNEALRLSGTQTYLSLFNGSNYKGYLWQKGADDIELGTAAVNTNGNLFLSMKGTPELTVQNDGRVRVGALACTIPVGGGGEAPPKLSVFGALGFKKTVGDQIGEWAIRYATVIVDGYGESLHFHYNGGYKAYIRATDGSWNTYSDGRLKEGFKVYKPVLEGIKKLDVLTYHYKDDKTNTRSFGLVAQNVQQYFPEIVSTSAATKDNMLGMDYSKTGVLAIKAIQEQQEIIEALQKQVEAVKAEIPMQIGKQQAIIEKQNQAIEAMKKEAEVTRDRLEKLEKLLLTKK